MNRQFTNTHTFTHTLTHTDTERQKKLQYTRDATHQHITSLIFTSDYKYYISLRPIVMNGIKTLITGFETFCVAVDMKQ